MTRINLIHVQDLADQHLFAEWREIKMIPAALTRSLKTKSQAEVLKSIPAKYTLNTGHVLFFYDKMDFLHNRYVALTEELKQRDYNISEHDPIAIFIDSVPGEFVNDWTPDKEAIAINVERVVQRLNERPEWYRHWGKITTPDYFKALYDLHIEQSV
jgi:deoxyribonuclease (pyrimidine dimer)